MARSLSCANPRIPLDSYLPDIPVLTRFNTRSNMVVRFRILSIKSETQPKEIERFSRGGFMRQFALAACALSVLLLGSVSLWASINGSISGVVTDSTGALVNGA